MCQLVCGYVLVTLTGVVVALTIYLIYRRQRWASRYFSEQGVDCDTPWPLFGNLLWLVAGRKALTDILTDVHGRSKASGIFGVFYFTAPVFIVTDPVNIQRIFTSDFEHFVDHRLCAIDPVTEPLLGRSLFMMSGHRWRDMRATFTQAFTGNKLRKMFTLVQNCCGQVADVLQMEAMESDGTHVVEMKDLTKRYMVDVIASTEFGYKVDSLKQPNNIFYTTAKASMQFNNGYALIKAAIIDYMPKICRRLNFGLSRPEHRRFFHHIVHDTMAYREQHSIVLPDMINLMAEARKGYLRFEENNEDGDESPVSDEIGGDDLRGIQKRFWNEDDVTAQCYMFFFVGAENSATLLSFAAQELVENRAVQDRLRAEMDAATTRLNGRTMTYDTLSSLPYLEMVVLETMRKWPPVPFLERICSKDYSLTLSDGRTVQLRQGDAVTVPLFAIHRDEQNYPDALRFDPERFSAERKHSIKSSTFLPLGIGPRCCIGSRYAIMTIKAFLFELLTKFTLEECRTTKIPAHIVASGLLMKTSGGINVQLRRRCNP